jgi:YcxB-like protein
MPGSVTCSYVFTEEEFITVQMTARRLRLARVQRLLLLLIGGLIVLGILIPKPEVPRDAFEMWFGLSVVVLLVLYIGYKVFPVRAFCTKGMYRKSKQRGQAIAYTLMPEGMFTENEDIRSVIKWPAFARATETKEGFALSLKGKKALFFWLPKHGFADEADIEGCRSIIREHMPNFVQH